MMKRGRASILDWRGMQTRCHSSSALATYKLMSLKPFDVMGFEFCPFYGFQTTPIVFSRNADILFVNLVVFIGHLEKQQVRVWQKLQTFETMLAVLFILFYSLWWHSIFVLGCVAYQVL
jgi:hypothetical protein